MTTVQEEDGLGSGIFGQPEAEAGEPKENMQEDVQDGADDPAVDEESARIQEYIAKYKTEDGKGIDVEKLAKEAMNAQKLIGQKGQEVGELRKKAEDLEQLISYVNADPKRLKAWNKLLAGDLEDGGEKPVVTSSEDLDKRLIEDMRAGKIAGPIKAVVKEYLQEAGLLEQVEKVKKTQAQIQAEQAKAARDAGACAFLAGLEEKGWTQKVPGKGHYFKDAELDQKFVELYNQGHDPLHAFAIAKEILGIAELPKREGSGGKKKAALPVSSAAKTSRTAQDEDDGGDEWAALRQSFEQAYGPDITKPRK